MNHDAVTELMKKKLNVMIEKWSPALKINMSALLEYLYLLSVGDHYPVTTFNSSDIMEQILVFISSNLQAFVFKLIETKTGTWQAKANEAKRVGILATTLVSLQYEQFLIAV